MKRTQIVQQARRKWSSFFVITLNDKTHMLKRNVTGLIVLPVLVLTLAACQPQGSETAIPTPPPVDTALPTETATIVWFPPTDTPTVAPSQPLIPTPVEQPGVMGVLFSDDFSDTSHWLTSSSDQGAAIIEGNRLTLAVRAPGASVITLRDEPLLGNFYAEVTATTALCGGNDDYGILFRTASGNDYYRFALVCDGTERVDRVRSGQTTFMQPAVPSGDAPPGSPGEVRIGVWAVDNEFRFFLNGRYQFTVYDPLFKTGTLGFFARSGDDNAVSISFSDLAVSEVVYASPTVTPTASRTPTSTRTPRPTP